jgi:hypothetical protein
MTYTPLNSGQCDPNKIKQLSFQIVIYKNYNNFQIVIGNSKYMIVLKPEKISGFSGRNLAVSKLQVKTSKILLSYIWVNDFTVTESKCLVL